MSEKIFVIVFASVFRTESYIYDGAFSGKYLTAKSCLLFSRKSFIADVWLDSKYAFSVNHQISLLFPNGRILIDSWGSVLYSHKRV